MPDLTTDHPAVEAAAERFRTEMMGPNWTRPWAELGERAKRKWRTRALAALAVALPHLTADDLRNTHAGRVLMAEAWEDGAQAAWGESAEGWNGEYTGRSGPSSAFRVHNPTLPNPYEETPNE